MEGNSLTKVCVYKYTDHIYIYNIQVEETNLIKKIEKY